ncbi:hypothetical protein [Vibrio porteresiae]|uniref:Uncharacterized protein n=1 Tax=Vibrio porteresiae DSM 19223 TaxID=1123496 RepID=A0ABZ0QIQ8_9VIBR|nr:hypothetical protein [Vibrio porteresiae]WPC75921.1 hypothetical protein R8Z52_23695 [Vibrio porteresiae DSM 19223]
MIIKREPQQFKQDGELGLYDIHELVDRLNYLSFPLPIAPNDDFGDSNEEFLEKLAEVQAFANELNSTGTFESAIQENEANYQEFIMNVDGQNVSFKLVNSQIFSRCDISKYKKQLLEMADTINATLYDGTGTKIKRERKGFFSFLGF